MSGSTLVNGQERTAKIIEVLDGDRFIVEIGGREYQAFNGDAVAEFTKRKIELQGCRENESKYIQLNEIAKRDVEIALLKADKAHGNFIHAMELYEVERKLRQEGSQFIPHGKVGGFGGKLLDAIESPFGQFAIKVAAPVATTIRVFLK